MGQECTISAYQHVSIGRECIIADRVMLIDFDHGVVEVERPIRLQGIYKRDVRVGKQCLDRLWRLHPARSECRAQQHRWHQCRRHQGRTRERGRRRRPGAGAANARRPDGTSLGVTDISSLDRSSLERSSLDRT